MPRVVQNWTARLNDAKVDEVGPPWLITTRGGRSSDGPSYSGLVGGYQRAWALAPPLVGKVRASGREIHAGSSSASRLARRTSVVPSRPMATTAGGATAEAAMATIPS